VQHWQCSLCGLRVQRADRSSCPESSGRLLQVHDWQDAFELARPDGVLSWEYPSRDEFLRLQQDIMLAGWEVDRVEEVSRGGLLSRKKIVKATLRPKAQSAPPEASHTEERLPEIWRPREPDAIQNGNGHGNGNGRSHEYENGVSEFKQIAPSLPAEADDLYQSYPEADDSAVHSND